jgi:hypothetical protein
MGTKIEIIPQSTPTPAPVGATLMKTGQTTSYRTGDDGDLEAGRATSFTVLASNNPFGNTNRFTDELGGQTYTNNIVIDWSTYNGSNVNGWYRIPVAAASTNWATAIDNSLSFSISTFTTGWRLPNSVEIMSIANEEISYLLNYTPFNIGLATNALWTSTTNKLTGQGKALNLSQNNMVSLSKTNSYSYIPVRTFTVTGTTLT